MGDASVPGAINLLAADLAGDQIVRIDTGGARSAQTTLDELAAFLAGEGLDNPANTNITTVGAGTLTGAALVGGVITRSGPTADYTDTTDTLAAILAALPADAVNGTAWFVRIRNTVPFTQTIAGVTGVTVSGVTQIPANGSGTFLLKKVSAASVTMVGLGASALPASKVTTGTGAVAAAGDITGAATVDYINNASNATYTTRTAAQMFADMPNAQVGQSYELAIRNLNATGLTLTAADASVTLSGTMSIAQNVTRRFNVTFVSAVAVTITSMGISAAAA